MNYEENLEPGSGKSSLHGGTPAIIMDSTDHWLYGWTRFEASKAKGDNHQFAVIRNINLDLYLAYIQAIFPHAAHLTKPLFNTSTVHYKDLLAIDQVVSLTQFHARQLEVLQERYETGQIIDQDGNALVPTKYAAQDVPEWSPNPNE